MGLLDIFKGKKKNFSQLSEKNKTDIFLRLVSEKDKIWAEMHTYQILSNEEKTNEKEANFHKILEKMKVIIEEGNNQEAQNYARKCADRYIELDPIKKDIDRLNDLKENKKFSKIFESEKLTPEEEVELESLNYKYGKIETDLSNEYYLVSKEVDFFELEEKFPDLKEIKEKERNEYFNKVKKSTKDSSEQNSNGTKNENECPEEGQPEAGN